jgi:hypothetical protein
MTERQLNPDVPSEALEILAHVVSLVQQSAGPGNNLPGYRMTDRAIATIRAAVTPKEDPKL